MNKRIIPRQKLRPPMLSASSLEWVTTAIGVEHNATEIDAVVSLSYERGLWIPDTPAVLPPIPCVFEGVLYEDEPFMVHGREKTLKTSLIAHLEVCIASGASLFGHFPMLDKSKKGPVISWHAEGGANYILGCIDKACAVYGVARRDLEIEVQTTPYPLNDPRFLYMLGEQVERMRPRLVVVEPLYLTAPRGWGGGQISDFDVKGYKAVATHYRGIPAIAHHDNTNESLSSLQRASGAGPAEFAGQWWNITRRGEWNGNGDHQLKLSYGARGAGGGQTGLLVDDETLSVTVIPVEELATADDTTRNKPTAYELALWVITFAMDVDDVIGVGELSNLIGGQIEARCGETVTSKHIRERVLPTLEANEVLETVSKTRNEHTVTAGPQFPQ
jgi:hypothetical protein